MTGASGKTSCGWHKDAGKQKRRRRSQCVGTILFLRWVISSDKRAVGSGRGASAAEQFVLPCGSAIHRDSQESWRQLEAALPGAALATTTTLLAALWPDDHFVFDWRVEAAANALRIDAGLPATRWAESEMEGRKRTTSDFSDYATVRSWLCEIDCPLNSLERALYRLSQKVPSVKGRSWPDYASAVANVLQRCDE